MRGITLYLNYLLDEAADFKNLSDAGKMDLIIQMVNRKAIKDIKDLNKGLAIINWTQRIFLDKFKELWDKKVIGWEELDALDTNDHIFKGPGFLSDRWLVDNIGQKDICDRIPPKDWSGLSYCKNYSKEIAK